MVMEHEHVGPVEGGELGDVGAGGDLSFPEGGFGFGVETHDPFGQELPAGPQHRQLRVEAAQDVGVDDAVEATWPQG